MTVTPEEIERAYRNDMSLRMRLRPEEWRAYLWYSRHLATLSTRWAQDLLTSTHILDARIQLLQIMLHKGHDIDGVNMFALLDAYKTQLQWTWEYFNQTPTPELEDEVISCEVAFMQETLRPDHFQQFLTVELRCEHVLRSDPKIFVPVITGLGRA